MRRDTININGCVHAVSDNCYCFNSDLYPEDKKSSDLRSNSLFKVVSQDFAQLEEVVWHTIKPGRNDV